MISTLDMATVAKEMPFLLSLFSLMIHLIED